MKKCQPYSVKVYCGLKEGYNGDLHSLNELKVKCQHFCNGVKLGVTITETEFVYVDGNEPGAIIGIINYPRFPKSEEEIKKIAIELAKVLMNEFKQIRVSIECPDEMIMLESEED